MAIRQSKSLVAAGLAALLLCALDASAGRGDITRSYRSDRWGISGYSNPRRFNPDHGRTRTDWRETVCENLKLNATAGYFSCLVGAYRVANTRGGEPSESSIANCDTRFSRAVEQAEALGSCHTPGNPSVLGDPIKARAKATALGITSELGGCTALTFTAEFATCTLGPGGRAVNLPAVIDAINDVGNNVDENTTFYIEAWGGDGGNGNVCCEYGGRGGYGGYVQTTTTTNAIAVAYGTTELYYFLGYNGTAAANAGGDGGTATMLTTNDLATEQGTIADTLLIAGGAGGGGAGRGAVSCGNDNFVYGALGGDGGTAIAALGMEAVAAGFTGGERMGVNLSGLGALGDGTGGGVNGSDSSLSSPATPGANGIAPIAGRGGNHSDPHTGFANSSTVITNANDSGQGGDGVDLAGGGGGGGGWGGGGGGAGNIDFVNSDISCYTGGGGGGASLAVASTATCSGAPTSKVANPSGIQGFARIVFDLGGCQ